MTIRRQKKKGGANTNSNKPSSSYSVKNATNNIKDKVSDVKSKMDNITNSFNEKVDKVKERTEKLKNNVGKKINEISEKASSATNAIKDKVKGSLIYDKQSSQIGEIGNFLNTFSEKNSIIAKIIFVVFVFIIFGLLFRFGIYLLSFFYVANRNPIVVNGMRSTQKTKIYQVNPNENNPRPILRSINENQGMEFTWSTWIWLNGGVDNSSSESKFIFSKGTDSVHKTNVPSSNTNMNAPGLYVDNDSGNKDGNTLKIVLSLFGLDNSEYNELNSEKIIFIENIPIQKWVNVIIRVQGKIVDIYINGTLTKREECDRVIKQNYGNVHVGSQKYGADGYISHLRYFDHAIGNYTIQDIIYLGPNLKMEGEHMKNTKPPYLSLKWYLNDS